MDIILRNFTFLCQLLGYRIKLEKLKENERAMIININGTDALQSYLLTHGITVGTIFSMNYSPDYSGLLNITLGAKMINLRMSEFELLEWVKI